MKTIDCTPTWNFAFQIYLAVLEQEWAKRKPNQESIKNSLQGLYEAANALDAINAEAKKNKNSEK